MTCIAFVTHLHSQWLEQVRLALFSSVASLSSDECSICGGVTRLIVNEQHVAPQSCIAAQAGVDETDDIWQHCNGVRAVVLTSSQRGAALQCLHSYRA